MEPHKHYLKPNGKLIAPDAVDVGKLPNKKTLNVALLGALSVHLPLPEAEWLKALREAFRPEFFEHNQQAFLSGRAGQTQMKTKTT